MILAAGGTGTLGTQVVSRLVGHGLAMPDLVDTVHGDLRDPDAVSEALRDCTTVISAVHGFAGAGRPSPEAIDRDANCSLVRAAVSAGVEHFVLLSVLGAAPDHPMSLHRSKYAAEQALRASALQWTIIRPAPYLETWVSVIGARIEDKERAMVFGPGRNPINFVSVRDVASLVDLAVRDPAWRRQLVEITGPENLTFTDIAERLIATSDRTAQIRHLPLAMLRVMSLLARPVSPVFARQAHAAVVMNSTDMAADTTALRRRIPGVPAITLDDVLSGTASHPT